MMEKLVNTAAGGSDTSLVPEDAVDSENMPLVDHSGTKKHNSWYIYVLTFFSALGGFLFGYDTGVISGAMISLADQFALSTEMKEAIVSITVGGAILGSVASAPLNNSLGRKPVLIVGSLVFTGGAVLLGVAQNVAELLLGRLIVGLGIGFASSTVPTYIAEAAAPEVRGCLVTVNQLFITFGQFAASVLNGLFSYFHDGWRYMLGVSGFPAVVMLIGFLFLPESPRWLVSKGKDDKARAVLVKLRGTSDVDVELAFIKASHRRSLDEEGASGSALLRVLRTPYARRALLLGCGLQAIQQLAAINTVMYYSATIIQLAGVKSQSTIIWLAAAVASGNFLFTLISMALVDRVGRRRLTLASVLGVIFALCLMACTFIVLKSESLTVTAAAPAQYVGLCGRLDSCYSCVEDKNCGFCFVETLDGASLNGSCLLRMDPSSSQPAPFCNQSVYAPQMPPGASLKWESVSCPTKFAWLAVLSMIFYLAMFAPGLGPMPWALNAEIYPLWARGIGISASTATNWFFNLLVSLTFLNVIEVLTKPGAFFMYAGLTLCGLIFLFLLMPETKGRMLEEVEDLFKASPLAGLSKQAPSLH